MNWLIPLTIWAATAVTSAETITGTVIDRSGGFIQNVSISAKGAGEDKTIKVKTDARGRFLLTDLQREPYSLSFDAPGFRIMTREAAPTETGKAVFNSVFVLDVDLSRAICVLQVTNQAPTAQKEKALR